MTKSDAKEKTPEKENDEWGNDFQEAPAVADKKSDAAEGDDWTGFGGDADSKPETEKFETPSMVKEPEDFVESQPETMPQKVEANLEEDPFAELDGNQGGDKTIDKVNSKKEDDDFGDWGNEKSGGDKTSEKVKSEKDDNDFGDWGDTAQESKDDEKADKDDFGNFDQSNTDAQKATTEKDADGFGDFGDDNDK